MSVARRTSSAARRTLLTAAAAGTLLAALWFVPSANANQDATARQQQRTTLNADTTSEMSTNPVTTSGSSGSSGSTGPGAQLADTGSIDTKPYLVGGTLFLGLGAGFVAYSVRRERNGLS